MSKKVQWQVALVVFAALVLGASVFLSVKPGAEVVSASPDENTDTQESVALGVSAKGLPKNVAAKLEAKAEEVARQRLEVMPALPVVPQQIGGFPREVLMTQLERYREMLSVQGLYNQNVVRKKLVASILETPQGAEVAARTIADEAFAHEAFGEMQAEARFFSIEVVKTAAKRGEERYLLGSAESISRELSAAGSLGGELNKGRVTDLSDLMHSFIDVKGVKSMADGDPGLVRSLGYSASMPESVKIIYDDVVFLRLKAQYGRERATQMTAALLEK